MDDEYRYECARCDVGYWAAKDPGDFCNECREVPEYSDEPEYTATQRLSVQKQRIRRAAEIVAKASRRVLAIKTLQTASQEVLDAINVYAENDHNSNSEEEEMGFISLQCSFCKAAFAVHTSSLSRGFPSTCDSCTGALKTNGKSMIREHLGSSEEYTEYETTDEYFMRLLGGDEDAKKKCIDALKSKLREDRAEFVANQRLEAQKQRVSHAAEFTAREARKKEALRIVKTAPQEVLDAMNVLMNEFHVTEF